MNKRLFPKYALILVLFFLLAAAGCQAEGIPASALLTPVHLRTQLTATLEPTWTATPEPPTPTDTAVPASPTITETPTDTLTPTITNTPTISPTVTLTPRFSPTFTRTATNTRAPSRTPNPTNTRAPTRTRTYTPTPTPPLAEYRLRSPGLYSRVVSPIRLAADALVGPDGYLNITLIGEDERVIQRQALDFRRYIGAHITLSQEIPFEINGAGETARLELSSVDPFGRIIGLTSVDLVLLKIGSSEIYPENDSLTPFDIRQPVSGQVFKGGLVTVEGLARPVNSNPVIVELINEQGVVVGQTQFTVPPPSGGHTHTPFSIYVPYEVSTATPVRLSLRYESTTHIPGTVSVTSLLINLEP